MRSFKMAIISFLILIGGCIAYTFYVNHLSQELISHIDTVYYAIANNSDWQKTSQTFDDFRKQYTPTEKKLYPLINHEQITTMNTLLDGLEQYIHCQDRPNALSYSAMLKFQFINIPQEEYISLGNLF